MSSKKKYQARRNQFQPVGRDRHIVVRGVQRDKPDLRKLSRVVIELAQAEMEREAQLTHEISAVKKRRRAGEPGHD